VLDGEFVFVIGANGAGKTTLFNIISGYEMPDSGNVLVRGNDITHLPQHKRAKWISSVLQDPKIGTVGEMTLLENLTIAHKRGERRGVCIKNERNFFKQKLLILEMGLENRLDDYVGDLSGGQRQIISLVMATLASYDILLLDEITSALDPTAADLVIKMTKRIVAIEKKTCMFITHNMHHFGKHSGKVIKIADGNVSNV
jgi:putative ABC transport system ATP-binding protein